MIWSGNGHLSAFRADGQLINDVGVIDFAGCGVVHMVGGISAMIGAWILGPRMGRFDEKGKIANLLLHKWLSGILSVEEACNGALAGLVGITSACSVVEPWASIAIGAIGAVFYTIGAKACLSWGIDDPVNASAA